MTHVKARLSMLPAAADEIPLSRSNWANTAETGGFTQRTAQEKRLHLYGNYGVGFQNRPPLVTLVEDTLIRRGKAEAEAGKEWIETARESAISEKIQQNKKAFGDWDVLGMYPELQLADGAQREASDGL